MEHGAEVPTSTSNIQEEKTMNENVKGTDWRLNVKPPEPLEVVEIETETGGIGLGVEIGIAIGRGGKDLEGLYL